MYAFWCRLSIHFRGVVVGFSRRSFRDCHASLPPTGNDALLAFPPLLVFILFFHFWWLLWKQGISYTYIYIYTNTTIRFSRSLLDTISIYIHAPSRSLHHYFRLQTQQKTPASPRQYSSRCRLFCCPPLSKRQKKRRFNFVFPSSRC